MMISYWDWAVIALFLIVIIYMYGTSSYDVFDKYGVKYVRPLPFVGNLGKMYLGKQLVEIMTSVYDSFPNEKYVGFYEFRKPTIFVLDPEIIKQMSIKDFEYFVDHRNFTIDQLDPLFSNVLFVLSGQKWKDMRMTLSPAFTTSKMKLMFPMMKECSENVLHHLKTLEIDSKVQSTGEMFEVEMKDVFARVINDIISTCAFGFKTNSFVEKENRFYSMGRYLTNIPLSLYFRFILTISFPRLMKLFNIPLMPQHVTDFFRNLIMGSIKEREEKGIRRPDMIQLLIEARRQQQQGNDNTQEETKDGQDKQVPQTDKRVWSDDDLAAQVVIFFLAGFDTVSSLLCFSVYALATNPDVQEKLLREAVKTCPDGKLNFEKLPTMKYMDMFISECMRAWPPVAVLDRKCVKPYLLPPPNDSTEKGYQVQTGDIVILPLRSVHLDPKYFPDPEKFDPERFSEQNKNSFMSSAFLPFGLGPRRCIGDRFALVELKIIIFHLVCAYQFQPCSRTKDIRKCPIKTGGMVPKNEIWVGLKRRRPLTEIDN